MVKPVQPYPLKKLDGTWVYIDPATNKEIKQMNERIRELADEAKQYCFEQSQKRLAPEDYMSYSDMYDKKFAELIVKECAGIYDKIDNGNPHLGTDNYLEALQKHFAL